jgi:hypothetical protein
MKCVAALVSATDPSDRYQSKQAEKKFSAFFYEQADSDLGRNLSCVGPGNNKFEGAFTVVEEMYNAARQP